MKETAKPISIEPRWPVVLAILVVLLLLMLLPARVRLMPTWVPYIIGTGLLLPVSVVWLGGVQERWRRIEQVTTLVFSVLTGALTLVILAYLLSTMVDRPADLSGRQLLASSISAWVTNVLVFSLLYWQMDRGGPEARANDTGPRPDWLFPQEGVPEKAPLNWRPTYVDYLFLSFSTATAFSTTEVAPLTSRAKLLMMFESTVSLVTLVTVAARAINILGG